MNPLEWRSSNGQQVAQDNEATLEKCGMHLVSVQVDWARNMWSDVEIHALTTYTKLQVELCLWNASVDDDSRSIKDSKRAQISTLERVHSSQLGSILPGIRSNQGKSHRTVVLVTKQGPKD